MLGGVALAGLVLLAAYGIPVGRPAFELPGLLPRPFGLPPGFPNGYLHPGSTSYPSPGGAPPGPAPSAGASPLLVGPQIASTAPDFFGVVAQTATPTAIATDPAIGAYLTQTPFRWYSYTVDTDNCNMSSNLFYSDNGRVSSPCPFDIPAFVTWCTAQVPTCHSILKLPGENNNSAEDAYLAGWIVHDLHFQPSYFTIGNEPMLWSHYGLPWTAWRSTDHAHPDPLAYAIDLRNAIYAVRAVDPVARFIGIESDCACSAKDWMATTARVDGSLISAVGYHTYPSTALRTNETLAQFFDPLPSPTNITASYQLVRAAIAGQCPTCPTLPIFVTEYNSGPGRGATQWAGTYADAEFLAASTAQALRENVSLFVTYNLQSGGVGNSSTIGWGLLRHNDSVGPEGLLYAELLSHLALGDVNATTIPTAVTNVWSVATSNATTRSLLVVNANLTQPLAVNLTGAVGPGNLSGAQMYSWQWSDPAPLVGPASTTVELPPLGMVLIDLPE